MKFTPEDVLLLKQAHIAVDPQPEELQARIAMLTAELARANERHRHVWQQLAALRHEMAFADREATEACTEMADDATKWYRRWVLTFGGMLLAVAALLVSWGWLLWTR